MSEIYSNDFLKIKKDKIKSIFTIELSVCNKILIDSLIITKLIQGANSTDDYKKIKFKAETVKSLKKFKEEQKMVSGRETLSINLVAKMLSDLVLQLNYLISVESYTIIGYNPENIIVINDTKFVFLGNEMVTEIKDEIIQISFPFLLNDFYVPPELLKINSLPSYTHYKGSYFSLACLIIYSLLTKNDFYQDYLLHQNPEKILENINNHPIKGTKLYWLLSRCLVEDPTKRSIILI